MTGGEREESVPDLMQNDCAVYSYYPWLVLVGLKLLANWTKLINMAFQLKLHENTQFVQHSLLNSISLF
jgi:hypothetical protein